MSSMIKENINLLPAKSALQQVSQDFITLTALIITFLAVSYIGINQQMHKMSLERKLRLVTSLNQQRAQEIQNINTQMAAIEAQVKMAKSLKDLNAQKVTWANYFKELSLIIPSAIWIDRLLFKAENRDIGLFLKGTSANQVKVSTFFERITKSNYYNKMLIKYSGMAQDGSSDLVEFEFATSGLINNNQVKQQ